MPIPDGEAENSTRDEAADEDKHAAAAISHVIVMYNLETDEIEHGWVFQDAASRDAKLVDVRECDDDVVKAIAGTAIGDRLELLQPPGWT